MLKQFISYGTTGGGYLYSRDSTGDRKRTGQAILLVLIVVFLIQSLPVRAQRKADIGFFTGVPWYLGDLRTEIPQPNLVPPAIGPILRYNFNMRNALRAHALIYTLSGSDENFRQVGSDFKSSFVDLGLDFEFNWWPYKTAHRKTKYSPYVSAGLGYSLNYTGGSVSHLYLPFGGGLKVNLGQRLSGGVEASMRKTFNDAIDRVTNIGSGEDQMPIGNNDWYLFTGLFVTYKIWNYLEECPTYD